MFIKKAGLNSPVFYWIPSFGNRQFGYVNRNDLCPQERSISNCSAGHKFSSFNQGGFSIGLFEVG